MTNGEVSYSVKELLSRIETKVDALGSALEKKADKSLLDAFSVRLETLNHSALVRGGPVTLKIDGMDNRLGVLELDRAQSGGRGSAWREAGRVSVIIAGWLLAVGVYLAQHYSH